MSHGWTTTRVYTLILLNFLLNAAAMAAEIADGNGPRLLIAEREIDLADLRPMQRVQRAVRVTNVGDRNLVIERVITSCVCTLAKAREMVIQPGASTYVDIDIDLSDYPGSNLFSRVQLLTNATSEQESAIELIARILPEYRAEPRSIDFGRVKRGASLRRKVTIEPANGASFIVTRVDAPSIVELRREDPLSEDSVPIEETTAITLPLTLFVTLDSDRPAGRLRDKIVFYTDIHRTPRIVVPIMAEIVGIEYTVSPRVLVLRDVQPGTHGPPLRISGKNDLEILKVEDDLEHLDFLVKTTEPAKSYDLSAHVSEDAPVGTFRGFVTLTLKEGDIVESVRLGVFGNVPPE